MKTIFQISLFLASLTILLISACEPVDDTASDDPRDPYIGEWQFNESFKNTDGQSYIVNIVKDPDNSSQVILENFGNPGSNNIGATGIVTSSQLVVSSQKMSNNWIVDGNGKFSNSSKTAMDWTLSITAGGSKDSYTATATKL
jgi:hypothetical protein